MIEELQIVVDKLAGEVGAPVVLEDRRQRVVVYSSQQGPLDSVRRDSILGRETAPEIVAYFRAFGIHESFEPVRVPGDPARGILGRLCVPARCRGRLVGFLWLIDHAHGLDADAVGAARRAADYAALLVYQEELPQRLAGSVLASLISPSEELREIGAARALEDGLLSPAAVSSVIVLQPVWHAGAEHSQRLADAVADAGRALGSVTHLRLVRRDHGVLLVIEPPGAVDGLAVRAAGAAQQAAHARLVPGVAERVVAAVGDAQAQPAEIALSYREARWAARVGAAVPSVGDTVEWRRLGAFRALAQLSPTAARSSLDPRVARLLAPADREILETLECFLDLGCDVKRTSERLHLHRATLYYRLKKVERVTGLNLRDGQDRLALHLGLKLDRLTGGTTSLVGAAPVHASVESG